jgi:4-hydroxymandelate synthase
VVFTSVAGFGDIVHRFTSRDHPAAPFAPGIVETSPEPGAAGPRTGLLRAIDHFAVCVPVGELVSTVRRYEHIFGFTETFEERIVVGAQAMDSKVVQSRSGKVTFTILEPDITRAPGQIDAFVRAHGGAGIQHVAFLTEDITTSVRTIAARGVRFLSTPGAYYDALNARLGEVGERIETLRELSILADRDPFGALLQIFTESRHPRGTFFYELIDRRGAQTFGSNNIQALYVAVERQQTSQPAAQG